MSAIRFGRFLRAAPIPGNTQPFLLEFFILRTGFIANGKVDGDFAGVVKYRTPSRPNSGIPVAPSAAFAAFRRAAAFFVTSA